MTNFAPGDRWQRIGTERAVRSVWTVTWEAGEDWGQVHSKYFVLLCLFVCLFVCFCLCIFRLCFVGDKLRGQRRKQWERERVTWDQALFFIIIIFFFLLLCFFGSRGKKSKVVSSRERHKGIIRRGHDLRLGSERQTTAETEQSLYPLAPSPPFSRLTTV